MAHLLKVNLDACQGHGLCYFESEKFFELRASDGKAIVLQEVIDDSEIELARRCVDICPERAITLTEV